jgi:flagellar hook-associated protein 3 FlgL
MRIASSQYSATMNSALQSTSAKVEQLTAQMASGLKLQVPSDDPLAAVQLSRLTRQDAVVSQYRANISSLKTRLQTNETYLDSLTNDMQQARDLLVWAADGSNSGPDVASMATSLKSLQDSLFYTTNTKDQEGRYVFSGTASNTPTVTYNAAAPVGSRYTFTGNTAKQDVVVGQGITQSANVSLEEMATLLNQLDATASSLSTGPNVNTPAVQGLVTANLNGLDATMNSIGSKIAGLGGAQNILSTLDANHANVSESNQQAAINIGQLDYGDAATQLNSYTTALQATQKAYAKVSQLSLFNVL